MSSGENREFSCSMKRSSFLKTREMKLSFSRSGSSTLSDGRPSMSLLSPLSPRPRSPPGDAFASCATPSSCGPTLSVSQHHHLSKSLSCTSSTSLTTPGSSAEKQHHVSYASRSQSSVEQLTSTSFTTLPRLLLPPPQEYTRRFRDDSLDQLVAAGDVMLEIVSSCIMDDMQSCEVLFLRSDDVDFRTFPQQTLQLLRGLALVCDPGIEAASFKPSFT
ncbi:unnamed protein product [Notodromas monacha]|uniref:Uncharacterized protein n=1 Tax=Notodromas monacha TaxID=399045 RepID=A0A7R9GAE2_9CRUS|nr:unnamed protein product [Notodromas monacha]CAG0915264.1 unnamed protein product [Notodromas monacha]